MNKSILGCLMFVFVSCGEVQLKEEIEPKSSNIKVVDTPIIELPADTADTQNVVVHSKNHLMPDTARILSEFRQDYYGSIPQIYLDLYFDRLGEKDSIVIAEWDSTEACAFNQQYSQQVFYRQNYCSEGGGFIEMHLPQTSTDSLHALIEFLFYENDYVWYNELKYQPAEIEAGCYHEIIQTDTSSIVKRSCGC